MKKTPFYCLVALLTTGTLVSCNNSPKAEKQPVAQAAIEFRKDADLSLIASNGDPIHQIGIEIADDDYARETGLMYRQELGADQGMLFIFPDEAERGFYMKNTHIPLDIIYFNADSTAISIHENTTPLDDTSIPSNGPAKFVLEINAGKVKEWEFVVGDRFSLNK